MDGAEVERVERAVLIQCELAQRLEPVLGGPRFRDRPGPANVHVLGDLLDGERRALGLRLHRQRCIPALDAGELHPAFERADLVGAAVVTAEPLQRAGHDLGQRRVHLERGIFDRRIKRALELGPAEHLGVLVPLAHRHQVVQRVLDRSPAFIWEVLEDLVQRQDQVTELVLAVDVFGHCLVQHVLPDRRQHLDGFAERLACRLHRGRHGPGHRGLRRDRPAGVGDFFGGGLPDTAGAEIHGWGRSGAGFRERGDIGDHACVRRRLGLHDTIVRGRAE